MDPSHFYMPAAVTTFDPAELSTTEGLETFGTKACSLVREIWNEIGYVDLTFFIHCTVDPRGQVTEPPVYMTAIRRPWMDDPHKEKLAQLVQIVTTLGEAVAVTLVSEVWAAKGDAQTSEAAIAHRQKYGTLETFPGRQDMAMVQIETARGTSAYMAEISTAADALTGGEVRSLGPFTKLPPIKKHMGRFSHLLKPVEMKAS